MASVIREIAVDAPADTVWSVIGDFATGPLRIAPEVFIGCELQSPGLRTLRFADGTIAQERLIARDEQARRIVWGWVDKNVTHDNGSMQVFADGAARSRVVWIHDTLPDEAASWLASAMDQLAPIFQRTLANQ